MSVVAPSLTVAVQPAYQIGAIATELLNKQILGGQHKPREVVLKPTIIGPNQLQIGGNDTLSVTGMGALPLQSK